MVDMKAIVKKLPKNRQTVLFSATINVNTARLKVKTLKKKDLTLNTKVKTLRNIRRHFSRLSC